MSYRLARSKGCMTCKRRKVKCDETKPVCARCQKAYLVCQGYANQSDQTRIIIYHGGQGASDVEYHRAQSVADASWMRPSAPSNLDLVGFKKNIWVSYLASYLFPGPGSELSGRKHSWILDVAANDERSAAHSAVCCVSARFFGRMHRSRAEEDYEGPLHYGNALLRLSRDLRDPQQRYESVNVAITLLLGFYEIVAHPNIDGWIQHAGGIGKLIEMRGPDAHKEEPATTYFLMSRQAVISNAIARRRRTFLEQVEWLSTSFSYQVPENTLAWPYLFNRCIDILARVPGLLEDSDAILCVPPGQEKASKLGSFRNKLVDSLRLLFSIRKELEDVIPNAAYEVLVDPSKCITVDDEGMPLYDTVVHYKTSDIGRVHLMYNTTLMLLLRICTGRKFFNAPELALFFLPPMTRDPALPSSPLKMPSKDVSILDSANEICRSVEFYLQVSGFASHFAINLLVPLRCIANTLPPGRVRSFAEKTLITISETHGLQFGSRLARMDALADDLRSRHGQLATSGSSQQKCSEIEPATKMFNRCGISGCKAEACDDLQWP